MDPKMDAAFDLILEFIHGFYKFVAVLTPAYDEEPSSFCLGYRVGLEGSMMLAKIANRWVTPYKDEENGEVASIKDFKPKEIIKN